MVEIDLMGILDDSYYFTGITNVRQGKVEANFYSSEKTLDEIIAKATQDQDNSTFILKFVENVYQAEQAEDNEDYSSVTYPAKHYILKGKLEVVDGFFIFTGMSIPLVSSPAEGDSVQFLEMEEVDMKYCVFIKDEVLYRAALNYFK